MVTPFFKRENFELLKTLWQIEMKKKISQLQFYHKYLISILLLCRLKFDEIIIADERGVPRRRLTVHIEKKAN